MHAALHLENLCACMGKLLIHTVILTWYCYYCNIVYNQGRDKAKEEEQKRRKTTPHFWNLNEDPQLTDMVVHFVKRGKSHVGNKKATPLPEILLNGLSVQK